MLSFLTLQKSKNTHRPAAGRRKKIPCKFYLILFFISSTKLIFSEKNHLKLGIVITVTFFEKKRLKALALKVFSLF